MKATNLVVSILLSLPACTVVSQQEPSTKLAAEQAPMQKPAAKTPETLEEMASCESDNECIVINSVCNRPTAINGKYRKEAESLIQSISQTVDCMPPPSNPPVYMATCKNSACELAEQEKS